MVPDYSELTSRLYLLYIPQVCFSGLTQGLISRNMQKMCTLQMGAAMDNILISPLRPLHMYLLCLDQPSPPWDN